MACDPHSTDRRCSLDVLLSPAMGRQNYAPSRTTFPFYRHSLSSERVLTSRRSLPISGEFCQVTQLSANFRWGADIGAADARAPTPSDSPLRSVNRSLSCVSHSILFDPSIVKLLQFGSLRNVNF